MFIYGRRHCTSAAVTPVKSECDLKNLASTFASPKNSLTEKLMNFAYREINEHSFSNPNPRTSTSIDKYSASV